MEYCSGTIGRSPRSRRGKMILPQHEERRHGVEVAGMQPPYCLLWFHALTRTVVPIGSTRRPRLSRLPTIKVREPERHAPWAARITREPAIDQLDPT